MEKTTDLKFFSQMEKWYLRKVANFPRYKKQEKIERIDDALSTLSLMLKSTSDFHFEKRQYAVLRWKLAQYLQSHENIDVDEVYESLLESPSFLENEDLISNAIEIFKKKRKNELIQRRKLEILSVEVSPEIVAEKISSEYILVRLLNWLHLDEETRILNHCIAKSDFYINRMMRGEYDVFSLRTSNNIPVATLVYNLKTNKIEQIRKHEDKLLDGNEVFYEALIEVVAEIRRIRDFNKQIFGVEPKELKNISDSNDFLFIRNYEFLKKEEGSSNKIINHDFYGTDVLSSLQNKNYYIPESTQSFLQNIHFGAIEANFVELSLLDLGLDQETRFTYSKACDIAKNLGYSLCSTQEACAYALQFPVQKNYNFYFFGMELSESNEDCYLVVGNNAQQCTLFLYGQETQLFNVGNCIEYDYKFIFKNNGRGGPKE